jgi:hypothetical protein
MGLMMEVTHHFLECIPWIQVLGVRKDIEFLKNMLFIGILVLVLVSGWQQKLL